MKTIKDWKTFNETAENKLFVRYNVGDLVQIAPEVDDFYLNQIKDEVLVILSVDEDDEGNGVYDVEMVDKMSGDPIFVAYDYQLLDAE